MTREAAQMRSTQIVFMIIWPLVVWFVVNVLCSGSGSVVLDVNLNAGAAECGVV